VVGVRGGGPGLDERPVSDDGGDNEMEGEDPLAAVVEGPGISNCSFASSSRST